MGSVKVCAIAGAAVITSIAAVTRATISTLSTRLIRRYLLHFPCNPRWVATFVKGTVAPPWGRHIVRTTYLSVGGYLSFALMHQVADKTHSRKPIFTLSDAYLSFRPLSPGQFEYCWGSYGHL